MIRPRSLAEGALYTDQYQLTMAQLYFRYGLHERPAQFDYFYRTNPDYGGHQAGYCVFAGLETLLDWMEEVRFGHPEIEVLRSARSDGGERIFDGSFLDWLAAAGHLFRDQLGVRAMAEGRVVHPNAPLAIVQGPLAAAQLLETPLLNHLNYPTLVATKASRMREAGEGRIMLEFGMRRAQERAATAGARAAMIGGADFTSNVGASAMLGTPAKGTHAHSMVQVFLALGEGELGAFRAYADVYPDDCLLLVDTVDTLQSGVPNAIRVFEELRARGHKPVGIRLDSGDLAHLAVQSAVLLDRAGFPDTKIVLSNQLDEVVLWQILTQIRREAGRYGVEPDALIARLVYGIGTRLITSAGAAALDGVYKLVAVDRDGAWRPAIKLSETIEKVPNPGEKRVWRLYDDRGRATADLIAMPDEQPERMERITLRHPVERSTRRTLDAGQISGVERLHVEALSAGRRLVAGESLADMRDRRDRDLDRLDPGVRRILNPHVYHVSLTQALWRLKQDLVDAYRRRSGAGEGGPTS